MEMFLKIVIIQLNKWINKMKVTTVTVIIMLTIIILIIIIIREQMNRNEKI